ncbi:MAG: ABC transporter ATP-binding protein [Candidatus Eremiobacteraeota bacterium]|nr:ABC transporter ATP-binding protein [Candidatus Eremiobacteraeota bacterium]MCW5868985.1 ABC transporter ATP-binding protein [Candidatus Eremiobacteraeota bacterium]
MEEPRLTLGSGMRTAYQVLQPESRRLAGGLVVAMIINAVVELAGVGGIMPFVNLASDPQAIEKTPWMLGLYQRWHFTDHNQFLIFLGAGFIALFALVNLVRGITMWLSLRFAYHVSHRLSIRLLESYLSRTYLWLRGRNSNELGKDILHETEQLTRNVYLPLAEIATNGLAALVIGGGLLIMDPWVAFGTGGALMVLFSLIYRVNRGQLSKNGEIRDSYNSRRFRAVNDGLYALKEARLLARREQFLQRYTKVSRKYNNALASGEMIYELPHYLTEAVAVAGLIGSLVYFALRYPGQAMAWLMLYVMATWRMLPSLQNMYRNLARVRFFLPSLQRLAAELHEPLSYVSADQSLPIRNSLELRDVHFTYPSVQEPVLTGLNLKIPKGSRVALVGSTGSGKTTVADMVAGLLVPEQGQLLIDGEPLDDKKRAAWRRNIGYVPQEIFLSDDSVSANIGLGINPKELDQSAVERAAQAAQIHDFIQELPNGYKSELGERGAALSGGQRQRIGIARALYQSPELLIFDEATSALDEATQRKVLESLQEVSRELTVLVIAHRLEAVRNCDVICLLENGKLVAQGGFDELLAHSSQFQALIGTPELEDPC